MGKGPTNAPGKITRGVPAASGGRTTGRKRTRKSGRP